MNSRPFRLTPQPTGSLALPTRSISNLPPIDTTPIGLIPRRGRRSVSLEELPFRHREERVAQSDAAQQAAPAAAGGSPHGEAHAALGERFRLACTWLGLPHLCTRVSCRHAGGCRGNPMHCLREGAPRVPASARAFVRGLLEAQAEGLSFEE